MGLLGSLETLASPGTSPGEEIHLEAGRGAMYSLDFSPLQYGSARGASPQSLLPGSRPSRWGMLASMSLRRNQESLSCSGASGELAIEGLLLGLFLNRKLPPPY